MGDRTLQSIKDYLQIPIVVESNIDSIHSIEMKNGKRAKRVIDMSRTNQKYYKSKNVHQSLLDHYENVDWYERDTTHDFDRYIARM